MNPDRNGGIDNLALEMEEGKVGHHSATTPNFASARSPNTFVNLYQMAHSTKKSHIMARIPVGSEGALTLCGAIEALARPVVAFVR